MKKKDDNTLLYVGGGLTLILLMSANKSGKNVSVTADFLLGSYQDLISVKTPLNYNGLPLHIYLARNTPDYNQIKEDYLQSTNRNLTYDIIERLTPTQLSEFVAELWKNNEQVLAA